MQFKHLWLLAGVSLGATLVASGASAQALSGQVSSAQENAMEGVLVSLKKEGSTIATTVVSNDKGVYAFPAGRLGRRPQRAPARPRRPGEGRRRLSGQRQPLQSGR